MESEMTKQAQISEYINEVLSNDEDYEARNRIQELMDGPSFTGPSQIEHEINNGGYWYGWHRNIIHKT